MLETEMTYYVIYSTTFDGVAKFGPYLEEEAFVQERHLCELAKNQHGMTISGTPGEMWDFTKGKEWKGCVFTYNMDRDIEKRYQKGKEWSQKQFEKRLKAKTKKEWEDALERDLREEDGKQETRSEIARRAAKKAWKTIREKKAKQLPPQSVLGLPVNVSGARECAILPCGKLDTTTGIATIEDDDIWHMDVDKEKNSALMVMKDPLSDKIRIVMGAGDGAGYKKVYPQLQKLVHDQSRKRIGYGYFNEHVKSTDFKQLQKYGKKLKFYVLK